MGKMYTSLWLILALPDYEWQRIPPALEKPAVGWVPGLIIDGISPNRMRKGKSGELPRRP